MNAPKSYEFIIGVMLQEALHPNKGANKGCHRALCPNKGWPRALHHRPMVVGLHPSNHLQFRCHILNSNNLRAVHLPHNQWFQCGVHFQVIPAQVHKVKQVDLPPQARQAPRLY